MRFFAQIFLYIILGFSVAVIQKNGDEGRPYEFGFTIDGQQHRHEKRDENGIIQGEFGFITADGVYHVTVYATDENGNFKILSMRNIRISAPLDGSPALGPISPEAGKYLGKISQSIPSTVQQPLQKFERLQQQPVVSPQLVTTAPQKTFDFTTQRTIKPACGGCGYVTTSKPFQFQNPAFQKPAGQLTGPSSGQSSFVSQQPQIAIQGPPTVQNGFINKPQGTTYTQNGLNNQQYQAQISPVSGGFVNYPSKNQFSGGNSFDSKPQLPSTASILHQNQGFGQPQAPPQGPASVQSGFRVQQNQFPIDSSFSNKPQLPSDASIVPQRQGLAPLNGFGSSQGQEQGLPQGLGEISSTQIRPDVELLPPGYAPQTGSLETFGGQNKQQQQYQNYQNQQNEISGNRIPTQSNLIQPPSPFSQHRADEMDYNQGPKELSSPPFVSSPKLPPQIEQISTLPPVSVSNRVIHVGGTHPQNIPITDKFPGMEDGLPDGVEEKDVKNILYKFKYIVGFHGHYEKGLKNGAKIGGYFVNGRDGISRVVTYVADENGYRPKFKFINLGLDSSDTPKEETEKTFGLKSFEFVWYPLE